MGSREAKVELCSSVELPQDYNTGTFSDTKWIMTLSVFLSLHLREQY